MYFFSLICVISFQPRGDRVGSYVKTIGSQMKSQEELDEVIYFHLNCFIFNVFVQKMFT